MFLALEMPSLRRELSHIIPFRRITRRKKMILRRKRPRRRVNRKKRRMLRAQRRRRKTKSCYGSFF